MRKLITIIAISALLIVTPATGAFAFLDDNSVNDSAIVEEVTASATNINIFPEPLEETTLNNNGKGYRGFNNPAEFIYPGMPSYFGKAMRNHNVRPVSAMIPFKDTFSRAEVVAMLESVKIKHVRDNASDHATDTIKVVLEAPEKGTVIQVALITTNAEDKDTLSRTVFYTALLSGMNAGADILFITAEGAGSILKSFGWGIGFSYTRATLSADEGTGGVSAGGTGISGGTAGYKSLPWIQALGLKLK